MTFKVYTYNGFGDQCICYGILKEFAKQHDKIEVYTDGMNKNRFEQITRLYSSIDNVELMMEPYNKEKEVDHCIAHTKAWFDVIDPWYHERNKPAPDWLTDDWWFDRQWYMNANVPFNLKWDNFFLERNLNKEKEVYYDILGLKDNEEFIFLHDDPSRNFNINRLLINSNMKIVELFKFQDVSPFDFLYTIEKAKEIHVFNTCTLTLIDLLNLRQDNLYYHVYARPWIWDTVCLQLPWIRL